MKPIMQEKSKLCYLNSLEITRVVETEVSDKEKIFITFPYPYMNGRLHLGHLFSLSKADFFSYFKEMQGYNVLFPLAFHCTGIPISSSAEKLQRELDGKPTDISTKAIIESMGFEDVKPFTNPIHWIDVFPELCKQSLQNFHCNIDWRRSFVTTELNKYYDSFIQWQFLRLREKGVLSFGKRFSIFDPINKQICLDHDRRKGENVKPIITTLCQLSSQRGTLLARIKGDTLPKKVLICKERSFKEVEIDSRTYFMEEDLFENMIEQVASAKYRQTHTGEYFDGLKFDAFGQDIKLEFIEKSIPCMVKSDVGSAVDSEVLAQRTELLARELESEVLHSTKDLVAIHEPEEEVISRSGGRCVVALTDQWYVDYSNKEWKEKVRKCLDRMCCDSDTRSVLTDALDWISKWGFSRSFGLGTKIPWDNQYLIDSLSDSTIYMAFYTVKHLLFNDLQGKDEIFPSEKLSMDVWNYIFLSKPITDDIRPYCTLLDKCRESFNYFYPVDLRVSGKDLLKNHLLFYLFNHVALFEENHWPRRIYTNGHLLLNSEKMSKSSGNFLSPEGAFEKFGVSATRLCLAVCGDTNEDANFLESNANAFILKLYNFVKSVEEIHMRIEAMQPSNMEERIENLTINGEKPQSCQTGPLSVEDIRGSCANMSFADQFLVQTISRAVKSAIEAHENMIYRDVVKYAFDELSNARGMYLTLGGNSDALLFHLYKVMTQLLYPIIPSLARKLISTYFNNEVALPEVLVNESGRHEEIEYLKQTLKKLLLSKKKMKNPSKVTVLVGNEFAEWKMKCMSEIDAIKATISGDGNLQQRIGDAVKASKTIISQFEVPEKRGLLFAMDYYHYPEKYVITFDEFNVLDSFKHYLSENSGLCVEVKISDKADPGSPIFEFQ